jgi:hypothetical protein
LRAWGDMAHVVKGMCERQTDHSSLEREFCLVGLNKTNVNHCNMVVSTGVDFLVHFVHLELFFIGIMLI